MIVLRLLTLALIAVLWPASAMAPPAFCYERSVLISHLAGKFDEHPRHAGIMAGGTVLEVLVSGDGGSFTMILSGPESACVISSGESWIDITAKKKGTRL